MNETQIEEPHPMYSIRPATAEDFGMIVSSWVKNYGRSKTATALDQAVYFREQTRLVDALIRRCTTIIAADVADSSHIYGWACGELQDGEGHSVSQTNVEVVLHYVYVKRTFRRFGIGKALVDRFCPDYFTHIPRVGAGADEFADVKTLVAKLAPRAVFNPYRAAP